jgi:hypothetical protein
MRKPCCSNCTAGLRRPRIHVFCPRWGTERPYSVLMGNWRAKALIRSAHRNAIRRSPQVRQRFTLWLFFFLSGRPLFKTGLLQTFNIGMPGIKAMRTDIPGPSLGISEAGRKGDCRERRLEAVTEVSVTATRRPSIPTAGLSFAGFLNPVSRGCCARAAQRPPRFRTVNRLREKLRRGDSVDRCGGCL